MLPLEAMFDKFGKTFQPDELIFCEFEQGNDFYLIQEGKVKITKIVGTAIKTIDILEPGEIFGEMAILEEQPRSASAIAMTEVRVLNFNRANFELLLTRNPPLAMRVLTVFTKRLYDAKRRLMILLLDDITGKVCDVFLMLFEKQYGADSSRQEVVLKITSEDVASWCGQPIEQVEKVFSQFKKNHKIEVYTDRIVIKNIVDMQRIVSQKRKA
ncbi:MAG: Crp/Fnr family transcriptional regulator [Spirochaetota bacterium]